MLEGMMQIKVLGTGCTKCQTLEQNVRRAVDELGLDAEVIKITDYADIVSYGVLATPALVIDGEVRLSGRVPSADDLKRLLTSL